MTILKMFTIAFGALTLSACSAFSSPFSCNETAVDGCLTIEAVNAMTERGVYLKEGREGKQSLAQSQHTQSMWVAPWVDKQGTRHQGGKTTITNRGVA